MAPPVYSDPSDYWERAPYKNIIAFKGGHFLWAAEQKI
jgi:hypothetical protein